MVRSRESGAQDILVEIMHQPNGDTRLDSRVSLGSQDRISQECFEEGRTSSAREVGAKGSTESQISRYLCSDNASMSGTSVNVLEGLWQLIANGNTGRR